MAEPTKTLTYLKVDNRSLSLRECWNMGRGTGVFITMGARLLRIPLQLGGGFPYPFRLADNEVPAAEVPDHVQQALILPLQACEALGFEVRSWTRRKHNLFPSDVWTAELGHNTEPAVARLTYACMVFPHGMQEMLTTGFLTPLQSGRTVVTSDQPYGFEPGEEMVMGRYPGTPTIELWSRHQQQVAKLRTEDPPQMVTTRTELIEFLERFENRGVEHLMRRGVYVPMTPEEIATAKARRAQWFPDKEDFTEEEKAAATTAPVTPPPLPEDGQPAIDGSADGVPTDPKLGPVMQEIGQLLQPTRDTGSARKLTLITAMGFLLVASLLWSVKYALLLVGVLLFHELGHAMAMKMFGYRNVKMFFIPFFGAAVSGQQFNVAAWKQVVVSFMGPVPGIILGCILLAVSLATPVELVGDIAKVLLLINLFNLLPILPLDGGWAMNAIIFCRNRWLETIFRVLAALALIVIAVNLRAYILVIPGAWLIFTSSTTFRISTLVQILRKKGVVTETTPDGLPAPVTINQILLLLRGGIPADVTPRTIAGLSLQIFEKLNTRPPGVLASLGLLGFYVATLVAALLFVALSLAPQAWEKDQKPEMVFQGNYATYGQISDKVKDDESLLTLICHQQTAAAASDTYHSVVAQAQPGETVTLFGQTVFITSDFFETRAKFWMFELLTKGRVLSEHHGRHQMVFVNLQATVKDSGTAQKLRDLLNEQIRLGRELQAQPVWSFPTNWNETKRTNIARARDTYDYLKQAEQRAETDLQVVAARKAYQEAIGQQQTNELVTLSNKLSAVTSNAWHKELTLLQTSKAGALDTNLLRLYLAMPADLLGGNAKASTNAQDQAWSLAMGELLAAPAGTSNTLAATSALLTKGTVRVDGNTLYGDKLFFQRTDVGLPALANYLLTNGCTEIHYSIPDAEQLGFSVEALKK